MNADPRLEFGRFHFHPDWYEPLSRYSVSPEYLQIVRSMLPLAWQIIRSESWFQVNPPDFNLPRQGWKIHVSATPLNGLEILKAVTQVLIDERISYKFALDKRILTFMTSKGWAREGSSKFITIYPSSEDQFIDVLTKLYDVTKGFDGPYILSDRRYKDSGILFYRYGGIFPIKSVQAGGFTKDMLVSPDGSLVEDVRVPYWHLPEWVRDPLVEDEEDAAVPDLLLNGRYVIEQALAFSVTGGVYVGTDLQTGQKVLVKEGRPHAHVDNEGRDAVWRLEREFATLERLADTGITPYPIDKFRDWEHMFIVEEFVDGIDLGRFAIANNPLIVSGSASQDDLRNYTSDMLNIWQDLADSVTEIHKRNIVIGDLSISNILIVDGLLSRVRIVDLEASWELGIDKPSQIFTPGFIEPGKLGSTGKRDDVYALAASMLATIQGVRGVSSLDSLDVQKRWITASELGFQIPNHVGHAVMSVLLSNGGDCASAEELAHSLKQPDECKDVSPHIASMPPFEEGPSAWKKAIQGILDYTHSTMDPNRVDRLFPADPIVYGTNPLSIAYGATGVAYAIHKIHGSLDDQIESWIMSTSISTERYAAGLYLGLSGVSWGLLEVGQGDYAECIMDSIKDHPSLFTCSDLSVGASGYGLTCLRFYLETKEQKWLDKAHVAGEDILAKAVSLQNGQQIYWLNEEGETVLGYARGNAGVALFLLYLHLCTGSQKFLSASRRAIEFVMANAHKDGVGQFSIPRVPFASEERTVSPYWLDGSAGVAGVLVRLFHYTGEAQYSDWLSKVISDTTRRWTSFPGLFQGLAGIGNFHLDAYSFTRNQDYLDAARSIADSILRFSIPKDQGLSFPGEQLLRLSTDFATGSAGIALFLHRLTSDEVRNADFNFTLDQYLQTEAGPSSCGKVQPVSKPHGVGVEVNGAH